MKLNKKQLDLLMKIKRYEGQDKSITDIGKGIYSTYRMVHINIDNFVDIGLVRYETKKNKVVPRLTDFGNGILRSML